MSATTSTTYSASELGGRTVAMKQGMRDRVLDVLAFSLPLLVAGVFFKLSYLRHGGLELLKASLGLSALSPIDVARLFASEVIEGLLYFPLVLLVAGVWVAARWRRWVYFACLELTLLVGVAAWLVAFFTIGRLPTMELAREFVEAYRSNPDFVAPGAVVAVGLLALSGLILALGVLPLLLVRWQRWRDACPQTLVGVLLALAVVLVPCAGLVATTRTVSVYHVGGYQRLLGELLLSDAAPLPDASALTVPRLKEMYDAVVFPAGRVPRAAAGAPPPEPARRDPNVIFIVLETACLRDYVLSDAHMPNVAALLAHSLVGRRHYSADPYSMRANFSIYSSVYDLRGARDFSQYVVDGSARPLDALPRLLFERGYATRYYFPHALWPRQDEEAMLRYLGFDEIYLYDFSTDDGRSRPERNAHAERAVYARVLDDLDALHAEGKPFFFAIANSIGHSPYFDIRPPEVVQRDGDPPRQMLVGNIAALMDQLIGTLVERLRALGILDDTILVITGDHGPRNRVDNAALDTRYSNDETYHVPLLIHYPAAFAQPVAIERVTSHVDLVPTVLQLMGAESDAYLHQGLPMFDHALADRVTFFFGDHYIGSDGLHYEDTFYMQNGLTQAIYANSRYGFGGDNLLADARGMEGRRFFTTTLARMNDVTWAWIAYLRAHRDDGGPPGTAARGLVHTFLANDDQGARDGSQAGGAGVDGAGGR